MQENKNILIATIASALVLMLWTWFYEKPRMEEAQIRQALEKEQESKQEKTSTTKNVPVKEQLSSENPVASQESSNKQQDSSSLPQKALIDAKDAVSSTLANRVIIDSPRLNGSINLEGAKFDDLHLKNYKENLDKDSKIVTLLSPSNSKTRYFADFGFLSLDKDIELPNSSTIWTSNSKVLSPKTPVTLTWTNSQNVSFSLEIAIDENYMFYVTSKVTNLSQKPINISSYGRVNKFLDHDPASNYILHEGPLGVFDGILHESQYKDMEEKNNISFQSKKSWLGISDKYWLTAIIPDNQSIEATFEKQKNSNGNIYNVGFVSKQLTISSGEELKLQHKLFAGAKEVTLLDQYLKKYDITLFDRAIDFGWYYFLTKPFFFILKLLQNLLGNYGLAILAMTVLVKLAMLPLANKSYGAMAKIRKMAPKIDQIRKNNKSDKMQMNKDLMDLYRKEGINPASGCLPILIQIPVFFSLYKVLYVTIDMRHQPFFGWIKDLSAPDPTSIFNLFGLLPFEISGGFFMIGVWPILMGLTMILQQRLGPKITDPAQEKVMKILPFLLIFLFAAFPAGLLIYWTWNNTLSIIQQYFINKKIEKTK